MTDIKEGTREKPTLRIGDYYSVLKTLIDEGENVYFILNELTLFLDNQAHKLKLVEVKSTDRVFILSSIAQTLALAQEYGLWPEVEDEILLARYSWEQK